MKAEIIFIGTELLLGQILNTNAVFLSKELASIGIDCYYQTVVGDNKERIQESFKTALQRADLVITTGGLGPTSDDLTIECWAEFFDQPLVFDEEVLKTVKARFEKANKVMSPSNKKLAYRPLGADILPNPDGSAPGIIWNVTKHCEQKQINCSSPKFVLTFPGVPRELHAMWKETAIAFLSSQLIGAKKLFYKELKFFGIGESSLAERIQDLLDLDDPTVAPLIAEGECRLRIATKASNQEEATEKIQKIEKLIEDKAKDFIYGQDLDTLESVVGKLLSGKNHTLAVAESCTGGLVSKRLTDIPGSSSYIKLNLVTYSNESKEKFLNVSSSSLESFGAVSKEVALEMAAGIQELAKTNWGMAITGVAGPDGGSPEKPVGTIYLAIVGENFKEVKKLEIGNRNRADIRWMASQEALNWMRQILSR